MIELPSINFTVLFEIVAEFIASLNLTLIDELIETLVAPLAGEMLATIGGVVSAGGNVFNTTSTQ
jgi:hypothetical protein